ncbi:flagellar hook-associated protein 3 FlgL [Virgibacillus subterraneus]|uniref:Flagellar hook-associated protein 3 FlgL n=2 Tax=Virgibacillus TaxID=84406 RepID=A0A1H0ZCR7_9BACI|nr:MULTISPECIES: flagellar hook-associated protein FlgL [Virgibacillus]SDQ25192.1 flagellar hook-associated protein 3 FlgL [Virgibacillus salinus]SEP90802.1 flagellar hook-associated protein 3 FlgL [Virgibacillus subterraneus]
MRITQGMLSNNMLNNLSNSYSKMNTYMNQLSTGKKINKPSDDPVIAMKGMSYRTELKEVEQYQRNTNEVHNWMDNSDAALDKTTQALQKLRELAVQASNDTYDDGQRENIMEEAEQLKEHLVDIANTEVNGKYIFNGTSTDTKPVTTNENGDITKIAINSDPVMIEVANGTKLQANVDAGSVFAGDPDSAGDMFGEIDTFINALADGKDQSAIEDSIKSLDANIDNVVNARADLGARMNRLELVENRLSEQEVIATQTMSENEDIDYEKVITKLTSQESIHRAALSAGSRIIQPTLMDFLR